eukprot:GEMP01057487.1.p1 GENE.GEMP01057487.1~~GEMP01057487.1.p1  ORF type:complete len:340 (-),score=51.84 GEMP01057487.1:279-1298(-)
MIELPAWICVIAGIVANALSGTGLVVQRKAKTTKDALEPNKPLWKNRTWQTGVSFTLVAAPIDFVSYLGAPLFVLALISCFRLPYIAMLSSMLLKEKIGRVLICAMGLCGLGAFLVITHLPSHHTASYETYVDFFTTVACWYFGCSGVIMTTIPLCMWLGRVPKRYLNVTYPFCAALTLSLSKALNVLFNKVANPPLYQSSLLLFAMLTFALYDFLLNLIGVQKVQPSIFAPVFFGFFNCLLLFQSLFIFNEFEDQPERIPLAVTGALLCLVGALLCRRVEPLADDDENQLDGIMHDSPSARSVYLTYLCPPPAHAAASARYRSCGNEGSDVSSEARAV